MAKAFSIKNIEKISEEKIEYSDILNISNNFSFNFKDTGYMCEGKIYTCKVEEDSIPYVELNEILEENVEEEYYLTEKQIEKLIKEYEKEYIEFMGIEKLPPYKMESFEINIVSFTFS